MRAMPSATESTVPTSERSAESASNPSIRSRRMLAISSGLISIWVLYSLLLTPRWRRSFEVSPGDCGCSRRGPCCRPAGRCRRGSRRRRGWPARPSGRSAARLSSPILLTTAGSSSTALVTVTSMRRFSCFQSSSNWRRMRKISGIRPFSISSSRKLTSSGSAPAIARFSPVDLLRRGEVGAEEEDLQVAGRDRRRRRTGRAARAARRACPSPCRPRREPRRIRGRPPASVSSPTPRGGEVDLAEGLLDEAALVLGVEAFAGDLLGRQHGEVGDLAADLLQRAPGLGLDVALGRGDQLLALLFAGGGRLGLGRLGRFAGAGHDVVGLLPRLGEPAAVLGRAARRIPGAGARPRRSTRRSSSPACPGPPGFSGRRAC